MSLVLAVDQGTTNTKVAAVDGDGRIVARHSERVGIAYPQPGWVESDADDIWRTVVDSIDAVLDQLGGASIAAIGVSNQRESVLAWDPTSGEVLGPVVSWQCTRGADYCRTITSAEAERAVRDTTGLPLDPMFSASKMRWLVDHVPDGAARAAGGRLAIGTVDTWLAWNLGGGRVFATDLTNASRTSLFDLRARTWSEPMLDLFGVPAAALPDVRSSSHHFGECRVPSLPRLDGVTIGSLIGDSHAALVGHGALEPGTVKASFGTGTSVMAPLGGIPDPAIDVGGLALTVGWSADTPGGRRVVDAVEGNIYATGAAIEWTADLLGCEVADLDGLAAGCTDTGGVAFVPAFSGLGAPHWDPSARGTIVGLTRGTGRVEVARATVDAVAHQVADVIGAVAAATVIPATLFADGGAMQSDVLAQTVADLTGVPLRRSDASDVAAIGAALLAGLSVGVWSSADEIAALERPTTTIEPRLGDDDRLTHRERWRDAVARASDWIAN